MDKEAFAATVTAQFNATLAGNKPAFLETDPPLVRILAQDLPDGIGYAEAQGLACIYNREAVAKELNLPKGADVDSIVRKKLEAGTYGKLLGYGMDTMLERPCHRVVIQCNGADFFGFMSSPSRTEAGKYAAARMQDFSNEFPAEQWNAFLTYLP